MSFILQYSNCGNLLRDQKTYCPNCIFLIGGHPDSSHKLERGQGVYRVFKDKAQADKLYNQFLFNDYDWKTLEDVKNELEKEKLNLKRNQFISMKFVLQR